MAIPDYQTCMLPLLEFYADGKEHTNRESTDALAEVFRLSEEEQRTMLPSGCGFRSNRPLIPVISDTLGAKRR